MSDKNTSPKKVFNPLLNVSVTGATIDEFTQNAILCPVPEPSPAQPEILEQVPLESTSDTDSTENVPLNQPPLSDSPNFNQFNESNVFYNQYQPQSYQDNNLNQFSNSSSPYYNNNPLGVDNSGYQPQADSNFNSSNPTSGLLSSFTSILSFGAQKKKEPIDDTPPVVQSAVEQLLSTSGEADSTPVPLFNPNQANFGNSVSPGPTPSLNQATTPLGPPPSSSLSGGTNTYRRQTQKRLTYAPIPGFSSNPTQPILQNSGASLFQPDQKPTIFSPPSVSNPPPVLNKTPPLNNLSSSFTPPTSSTFPSSTSSAFAPPPSSAFPPPPSSTFAPPTSSTFQTPPPSNFLPPTSSTFPPPTSSTFPPQTSSNFLPPTSSNFPPPTSSTFLPPTSSTFPPPISSSFPPPTSSGFPPPTSNLPPSSFPPPTSSSFPPPPQVSYFQPTQQKPVFPEINTTNSTTPVTSDTSLNAIPSSIPEINPSWTSPIPTNKQAPTNPQTSWNPTPEGIPSSYWNPTTLPSIPSAVVPPKNIETSSNQATPINFFTPPTVQENPSLLQEVKSPFLIPEVKPSNFLIPTTEVQSLDGNNYFSGFVMSNTSNESRPTVQATLNTSTTTMRSVSPMATAADGTAADAALKPNAPPYRTVYHHWFHKKEIEGRVIWIPFSMVDSLALEAAFVSTDIHPEHMVAVDGGRYDVNILRRQRIAVYWEGTPTEVRRCSWFYKGNNDGRFTPYEENIATKLEEEYKAAYEVNQWHRKVDLPNGETVVFHAPDVLVLFPQSAGAEVWNTTPSAAQRPRVVKRGMDEFDIDEGEPTKIDHLLFLVHGIGSVCDLKFRSVEEVVDDFRSISLQLVQSHYKTSCEQGIANRIEVLPVSWHNQLHSEDTGIDKKLKSITLESIPKLRDFTNDTLLDILFYTSPIYCQTIISTVGTELNRIYDLFKTRNPGFKGSISLGGHSLGSLILFDILCHQHPPEKEDEKPQEGSDEDQVPPMRNVKKPPPHQRRLSRRISYMMGKVGTGQPQITYPHLNFHPIAFFALGSPIGMFVTVRGLESLGEQFALPTCPGFFNIFHPYDPVAYRIESLINSELGDVRPVLIPHHKGRKRMHLELKETMARVGADLKQRIMESMKNTWNSVYQFTMFHRQDTRSLEAEVDKVLEEQMIGEDTPETEESSETDLPVGILNNGRRIDYVLQEAPFEFFNEYIFALTSHVCYWESEDTMLLILKEIYSSMGIQTDSKIPQQTMSIERASPSPSPSGAPPRSLQMADPLRPMVYNSNQGPPPSSGFIRKT